MDIFGRTFGVEIEILAPVGMTRATMADLVTAAGIDCRAESYGHVQPTQWKIVTDGSLRGGNGMEIVSPPLAGEAGLEQVRKVCAALTRAGCRVNRSCGLHVHVEARSLGLDAIKRLVGLYLSGESVIDSLLPLSRRGGANMYCKSLTGANRTAIDTAYNVAGVASAVSGGRVDRYVKLNLCSFWRHGTVEFRQHSGTVDGEKAIQWIRLCLRMVAAAMQQSAIAIGSTPQRTRAIRPGSKLATIVAMLTRPEGCSQEEVLAATGWPTVSMPQQARAAGLVLIKRRVYGRTRYYAEQGAVATPEAPVDTLEGLAERLAMPAADLAYWTMRRDTFAEAAIDMAQAA